MLLKNPHQSLPVTQSVTIPAYFYRPLHEALFLRQVYFDRAVSAGKSVSSIEFEKANDTIAAIVAIACGWNNYIP